MPDNSDTKLRSTLRRWIDERGPLNASALAQLASTPMRETLLALHGLVDSGSLVLTSSVEDPLFDLPEQAPPGASTAESLAGLACPEFPALDWVEIGKLVQTILRDRGANHDVEDLAQEALLRIACVGAPERVRDWKHYAKRITLNVFKAWYRKRCTKPTEQSFGILEGLAASDRPDRPPAFRAWLALTFLPALRNRLPPGQRAVLASMRRGNMTNREIARDIGGDPSNVRRMRKTIATTALQVVKEFPPPDA